MGERSSAPAGADGGAVWRNARLSAAACVLIAAVCLLFASRKSGMFIDEIYSYGLANSWCAPFVTDIKGGDLRGSVFTRQELTDYLSVGDDDAFAAGSVYYNQTRDVHPPLYYWLLNFVCSLFKASGFTKWTALGLNLPVYLAASFLIFSILSELGSGDAGAASVLLYGLSGIGVSTFLYIRMYTLLTFFTLLTALFALRYLKSGRRGLLPLILLSVFCGAMTQYYYLFYAFFLCCACCVILLAGRRYRDTALFSLSALAGVALAVLAFPACLKHIFVGNGEVVSGSNALENLASSSEYLGRLEAYLEAFRQADVLVLFIAASAAACAAVRLLRRGGAKPSGMGGAAAFGDGNGVLCAAVCVPALLAFVLTAVISPVLEKRYVYNLAPFLSVIAGRMLSGLIALPSGRRVRAAVCAGAALASAAFSLLSIRRAPPDYLFPEEAEKMLIAEEYSSLPCVYYTGNYPAPITADILKLMKFESFLATESPDSEPLRQYLGGADRYILFVSNSWYWAMAAPPDAAVLAMKHYTGCDSATLLFESDISLTYLMEKRNTLED